VKKLQKRHTSDLHFRAATALGLEGDFAGDCAGFGVFALPASDPGPGNASGDQLFRNRVFGLMIEFLPTVVFNPPAVMCTQMKEAKAIHA